MEDEPKFAVHKRWLRSIDQCMDIWHKPTVLVHEQEQQ